MMAMSGLVTLATFLVLTGLAIFYIEHYGRLQLPAPSFQNVGPSIPPTPVADYEGKYASTSSLHKARRLYEGKILSSESVAVSQAGELYMLDRFGIIWKADKGGELQRLVRLGGGRPLGFHFDGADNLLICNAGVGLQMLERETLKLITLASEAPDGSGTVRPIHYANDLAFASDGVIYFTDSCDIPPAINPAGFYDTMASFLLAAFQGNKTGRLLKNDPHSKTSAFVSGGYYYANGVALGPNDAFILVVETAHLRVLKRWLSGPKAGKEEVFVDKLPGYPDGLTEGSEGTYWLSLVTLKSPALNACMKSRILRWLCPRLPPSLKKARLGTAIVQLSPEGRVLRYLDDIDGSHIATISAVTETKDGLYLGNLGGDFVSYFSKLDLPPVFPA